MALAEELESEGIKGQEAEVLLESRDEYTAENVFWVPLEARWKSIQERAKQPNVARLIDDAMYAIEGDNPALKGKSRQTTHAAASQGKAGRID